VRPSPAHAVALAAVLGLAGAGCGGEDRPGPEDQVRTVLSTFASAAERHDYQTICDDVLAPKLLSGLQSIGLPCEVALRNSLGSVRNPRLSVGRIDVEGASATAQVRTSADGQQPSTDTVRLDRFKGGWKISALGAP
jgi:hypothetical protein